MAVKLAPNARWDRSDTGIGAPFTWCAWFRPDELPADFAALAYFGSVSYSQQIGVFIHQATSRVSVWDASFTNRATTSPLTVGEWVFIGVAVSAGGDLLLGWRTENDTTISTDTGTVSLPVSDDYFYLGSDRNTPDFEHTVDAAFSYARVFDGIALTASAMMAESGRGRAVTPVGPAGGDWPLDETSGLDESGNDNHLSLEEDTGSASLTTGPNGVIGPPPPFPDGPIEHRLQLMINGGWVDATADIEDQQIRITRGKGDESARAQPAEMAFTLHNPGGDWTPGYAEGVHWPHIRRGVPAWYQLRWAGEWHTRFYGEVTGWSPLWPQGDNGDDSQVAESVVDVQASGVLRRLIQGAKPLHSALRRQVMSPEWDAHRVAYWPLEDTGTPEQASTPMPGVRPMVTGGPRNWAADDTFPGSAPVLSIPGDQPAGWQGHIPPRSGQSWACEWHLRIPEARESGGFFTPMIVFSTGATRRWEIALSETSVRFRGYNRFRNQQFTSTVAHNGAIGPVMRFRLEWNQNGTAVQRRLRWGPVGTPAADMTVISGSTNNHTAGRPTSVAALWPGHQALPEGLSVAHVVVSSGTPADWLTDAGAGWVGEPAGERLIRLCQEEGIDLDVVGDPEDTSRMGEQRPETVIALLDECANADAGVLAEPVDGAGLQYRTRRTLQGQEAGLVLDAETRTVDGRVAADITHPLTPTLDDQRLRNDVTVEQLDGTHVRVIDQDSIDTEESYSTSVPLNLHTVREAEQHAGWLLALGTLPDMRLPSLTPHLDIAPHLIPAWLATRLGDRAVATNLPAQWPHGRTVDVLVESWQETISPHGWDVTLTCSPAGPWHVGVLDDDPDDPDVTLPRLDTDGTVLGEPLDTDGPGSFTAEIVEGPMWTTDPAYFPLGLLVGGEEITVSGIADLSDDDPVTGRGDATETATTSHVAPSVDAAGASDLLVAAACSFLEPVSYTVPSGMTADAQTSGDFSTAATAIQHLAGAGPVGDKTFTLGASDAGSALAVVVHGTAGVTIEETRSHVSHDPALTVDVAALDVEPGWWLLMIQAWDWDPGNVMGSPLIRHESGGAFTTGGVRRVADTGIASDGTSRLMAHVWRAPDDTPMRVRFPTQEQLFDNHVRVLVLSGVTDRSQAFTVSARSVNGVTKTHPAGSAVTVANPIRLAL